MEELLAAEVTERRKDPDLANREDILSMLVGAHFEDGEQMSGSELRDQLMTLLLAGHETTATGLAWTFDLLLRHPSTLERLRSELDAGEEDYLRAVIAESLRLRPVIPLAGRRLREELRVNGLTLPPGTDVTPAIWLTDTREDLYPAPLEFGPIGSSKRAPRRTPGSHWGRRCRCLGASFAEFEMRIVLRETFRRRELRGARRRRGSRGATSPSRHGAVRR